MVDRKDMLDTEWDLLTALWALQRGTARDVAEYLKKKRDWSYSTVKTLLDRMVQKDLVAARQVGNVWEYTPAVDKADAQRGAWSRIVDTAFGGETASLLHFVAKDARLSRAHKAALKKLLDDL